MQHRGWERFERRFDEIFGTVEDSPLHQCPLWVRRAIGSKLGQEELLLVSAVCPDYEIVNGCFTYRKMGQDLPYTARRHLEEVKRILPALVRHNVQLTYHMTLADTEFDLPLVVEHLAAGDQKRFLDQCQNSCDKLLEHANESGIPLLSCRRFTEVFQGWFPLYHLGLEIFQKELPQSRKLQSNLSDGTTYRVPLYAAMAGQHVSKQYCRDMVIRQWAQYAAWGECAEQTFGPGLVMMNHLTPNLGFVNHLAFRKGRARIPIIKLPISTMPA